MSFSRFLQHTKDSTAELAKLKKLADKPRALTKSVVAKPTPPNSRTILRNGKLVNPANGDSKYRDSNSKLPNFNRSGNLISE